MADDWITTKDAIGICGYTADHLRTLIRQGRIKAKKFFVVWLVSRKSLDAYVREQAERGERRGRKRSL